MWTRLILLCALASLSACDNDRGLNERRRLHAEDAPTARQVIRRDINQVTSGVSQAAERVRRGFLVEEPARREREIRGVLRQFQRPESRLAIDGLMAPPITFVAAVGTDGVVICRDSENDQMRGMQLAEAAPVVRRALDGEPGRALSRLPSLVEDAAPSVTVLFAHPAVIDGNVVGAIVAGLPLWRIGQQLSRQFQLTQGEEIRRGHLIWALLYDDEQELHSHVGFPPDLRALTPDPVRRAEGLARSPGGFTGELQQFGRWYGYAVVPVPSLDSDVGLVLFRSDPI